jgi:hypothetical protein
VTKGELGAIVGAIVARLDAAAAAAADETHYGLASASSLLEDLVEDPEFLREIGSFNGND